jgi:CRP-like cAMP-binding protein
MVNTGFGPAGWGEPLQGRQKMPHRTDLSADLKIPRGVGETETRLLLRLPLFQGLKPHEMFHLIGDAWVETTSGGSLLFLQGDSARFFYVVLAGWVKLYRSTADGNESVIAVLPPGDSFAEAAAFEEGTYPVSAAIVEDARLLVIPAPPFVEKVLGDGRLVVKMMASMSRRLRQLVMQVEDLSLRSSVERLAAYLTTLSNATEGATTVRLPFDKALIASQLGMQPETLSRSLARLRTMGIAAEGNRVEISDIAILHRLAGEARAPVPGIRLPAD